MSLSSIKITLLGRYSLNFAANIIAAGCMLLGSVRAFYWVKPTLVQCISFLLFALSANVLFAWLSDDTISEFNTQGLISYLVWPTIMLVAGVILANRTVNYALLFVPAILWLVADTLLMSIQSLIQLLANHHLLPVLLYGYLDIIFVLLFVWQTTSLFLIFAKELCWPWWERTLMIVGAILLLFMWQKNVADQPIFKTIAHEATLSEAALYAQPALLSAATSMIASGQAGISEWYFLGVAGYGAQDVFANEIDAVRGLFDVRFGTKHHSVALINHPSTWLEAPIASKTSIKYALDGLGAKMNLDEDVLFLALSSHGVVNEHNRPTGEIAMFNPPLALEQIDGTWLKQALDESGIRWRVIVISACYSGAFIEPLKSPTTLIITASDKDKASFGCSADADLSYFGREFFANSLRTQDGFAKAFDVAKRRIAEREALMGFEPSLPQMYIGDLMNVALPEFEKALFGEKMQDLNISNNILPNLAP